MINKLIIQNFQSHKDTELEFTTGVNIITGPTDSGKSAIIRALRWLIWNRPNGDAFCSDWGGTTMVHIETDTDKIGRWRNNTENKYRLNTQSHFEAFKTDVPDEIINALNFNDINLQQQHDSIFLLSQSAGNVAEFFNRVAHLDKIDIGLQNINRAARELTQHVTYKTTQLTQQEDQLKQFANLEYFEADVEALEQAEQLRNNKQNRYSKLQRLLANINAVETEIENNAFILRLQPLIDKVDISLSQLKIMQQKRKKLANLTDQLNNINAQIFEQSKLINAGAQVIKITGLIAKRDTLTGRYTKLNRVVANVKTVQNNLLRAEQELKQAQHEFDVNMPDICPLCGNRIKN